jgi:hypothetical protein
MATDPAKTPAVPSAFHFGFGSVASKAAPKKITYSKYPAK